MKESKLFEEEIPKLPKNAPSIHDVGKSLKKSSKKKPVTIK